MEALPQPPEAPSPLRDPEFAAVPLDRSLPDISPEQYLRVVANPFLGLAGLAGWALVLLWVGSLLKRNPELIGPLAPIVAVLLLASLWLIPALFHYHCLDCGGTGRLSSWRQHTCPNSTIRRLTGRPRLLHGPTPFVQIILWLWAAFLILFVFHEAWGQR